MATKTAMVAYPCPGEPISRLINTPQTSAGFARLKQMLLDLVGAPAHVLVVMEATGA